MRAAAIFLASLLVAGCSRPVPNEGPPAERASAAPLTLIGETPEGCKVYQPADVLAHGMFLVVVCPTVSGSGHNASISR